MKTALITIAAIGLFLSMPFRGEGDDVFATHDALTRYARAMNPIFEAMRPAAKKILVTDPNSHAAIVEACLSQDEHLMRFEGAEVERVSLGRNVHSSQIELAAKAMLDPYFHPRFECRELDTDRCAKACREAWRHLADRVDALRAEAKKMGITIVSLR